MADDRDALIATLPDWPEDAEWAGPGCADDHYGPHPCPHAAARAAVEAEQ